MLWSAVVVAIWLLVATALACVVLLAALRCWLVDCLLFRWFVA